MTEQKADVEGADDGLRRRNSEAAIAAAESHMAKAEARLSAVSDYHEACDTIDKCKSKIARAILERDESMQRMRDNDMTFAEMSLCTGLSSSYIGVRLKRLKEHD